jgi:hypothetical protein
METSQRSVITVSFVSSKKVATQNTLDCPKEEESCTVDHRFVYEYSTVVVKMIASLCIVLYEREYENTYLSDSSARRSSVICVERGGGDLPVVVGECAPAGVFRHECRWIDHGH